LVIVFLKNMISYGQVKFETYTNLHHLFEDAQRQRKLIMVEGYTNWCGWCKVLDKKVFSDIALGQTINEHFISTKFEMEKDSLGMLLAQKYGINAFPTILLLNSEGMLIETISGYSPVDQYLKKINKIIDQYQQNRNVKKGYSTLTKQITYPLFYYDMFPSFPNSKKQPPIDLCNQYIDNHLIEDEVTWNIIKRISFALNPTNQDKVFSNLVKLKILFYEEEVDFLLQSILQYNVSDCIKQKNKDGFDTNLIQAKSMLLNGEAFECKAQILWHQYDSNWLQMAIVIYKALERNSNIIHVSELNDYAWSIYEYSKVAKADEKALKWMENYVLPKDSQYAYLDTYAALLFKRKQYKKAKYYVEKAIMVGKKTGDDITETEKLFELIKQYL
jgi:thioredoxin-related protein